jgi:hypothetical protein
MWWICPSTTKQHGSTNSYFKWANKRHGHGNIKPSMKGKFISTFQVEGAQNFNPLKNNIKGLNKSTNNNI